MKIYFAGCEIVKERALKNMSLYRERLYSYFYVKEGAMEEKCFKLFLERMKNYLRRNSD